ncbi:MAG TPA: HIT family protein [Caulobacteraceae bacterium]|jgi:histidine triad (HIT) family protein|nr:HIT family protein [Caulobacteraceae bacterium]
MSLDGTYDDANLFAKMVRGEAPCAKVYEDDDVLAFLDLFPQSRGHTLVISKTARARNLLDVEPAALQALIVGVQKVARGVRAALDPDGVVVTQFNGAPAGQTVFHLHFHIIPRYDGVPIAGHGGARMADTVELAALAKEIAAKI